MFTPSKVCALRWMEAGGSSKEHLASLRENMQHLLTSLLLVAYPVPDPWIRGLWGA